MPVLFVGHGSPMNAVRQNAFTRSLNAAGRALPAPNAVLCVSAHWYGKGLMVQSGEQPPVIHDFYGFPDELYAVRYPAPGSPAFAAKTRDLLAAEGAELTVKWGLDHGAWSVLVHLFPNADVPVYQLSLDYNRPLREHYELAKRLKPLREEGVLILGSGNIVHNLRVMQANPDAPPFPWTEEFDAGVKNALEARDHDSLIDYPEAFPRTAALSVPTPDHYLPLLYCLAASDPAEPVSYPYEGYEHAAISMRSVRWG